MKISTTLACRYLMSEALRVRAFQNHVENIIGTHKSLTDKFKDDMKSAYSDPMFDEAYATFHEDRVLMYVFTQTVQNMMSHISLKEEKKFDYLSQFPDGDYVWVLNQNEFFKAKFNNGRVVVVFMNGQRYTMFNFKCNEGVESIMEGDEFMDVQKRRFMQIVIFLAFTEPEIVELYGNGKSRSFGTKKSGKVLNDVGKFHVTVVNAAWNKTIIRNSGFTVNGHLALRAYGVGRTQRRLVWIEPYAKNGYKRKGGGVE